MMNAKADNRDALLPVQKTEPATLSIFDFIEAPLTWESEWWGMPEFVMGNTEPVKKITVSFSSMEDVEEFARLLDLRVTKQTDSVWFPQNQNYVAPKSLRWADAE